MEGRKFTRAGARFLFAERHELPESAQILFVGNGVESMAGAREPGPVESPGLDAGKISLELSPVDPGDVVGRLRPLMQQLARGRPVAAVCECDPVVPLLVTDPLRLEQVLTNLVTNAFKFTAEGRVVLRVGWDEPAQRVRFEVADTGIGIPARELPFIFDEFRQVDGSMARRHDGIGLGLALVRKLMTVLGGTVEVTSRMGAGSTFAVTLPVRPPRPLAVTALGAP